MSSSNKPRLKRRSVTVDPFMENDPPEPRAWSAVAALLNSGHVVNGGYEVIDHDLRNMTGHQCFDNHGTPWARWRGQKPPIILSA